MATPIDKQQDLENYFAVARTFGPFFVPFEKKFSYDEFKLAVSDRATSIYPLVEPIPARIVYLRAITYETEKPSPGDSMIPYPNVLMAVVDGLVSAGVLYDRKQVYGLWGFRDYMPDLPSDVMIVQVAWGP